MRPTMVLFDLDGTLLPMDNDEFTRGYFKLLVKKLAPYGYEPEQLIDTIWAGVAAMVKNDGGRTNEEAFWARFAELLGPESLAHRPVIEEFYNNDFEAARTFCGYNPAAAAAVRQIKAEGFRVALATNPIFPARATQLRIGWTGLAPEEFELYTTYENCSSCKPNPAYFLEAAGRLGVAPERCLMVGNDAHEDMVAEQVGMRVFLLTDCLINKRGANIDAWPHGGFAELMAFVLGLD